MEWQKVLEEAGARKDEQMNIHTTFNIGGACSWFVEPMDILSFKEVYFAAKQSGMEVLVIGNGSNILVLDEGFDGIVISTKKLDKIRIEDGYIIAGAGISNSTFSEYCIENSFEGFEFASGIPGTLGGGVFMNAGAYDGEMKEIVEFVYAIDEFGNLKKFLNEECNFGKRHSIFHDNNNIVVEVGFSLKKGDKNKIAEKVEDLNERRRSKQPLEYGSAGSVFKRPEGYFASKLIEDSGLKGLVFGNAEISSKHSGFIVNKGGATAKDVLTLISIAKKVVNDKYGVLLEREVRIIGHEIN